MVIDFFFLKYIHFETIFEFEHNVKYKERTTILGLLET
jgi:hypothetical protein